MAHSLQEWHPYYGLLQLLVQCKIAGSDGREKCAVNSDISAAFIHSRTLKLLSLKFYCGCVGSGESLAGRFEHMKGKLRF